MIKKPFTVICREEGRGKGLKKSFATLDEASAYIQDRWQGVDYMDGRSEFHTDYSTYELVGFTLLDIGKSTWNAAESYREFEFDKTFDDDDLEVRGYTSIWESQLAKVLRAENGALRFCYSAIYHTNAVCSFSLFSEVGELYRSFFDEFFEKFGELSETPVASERAPYIADHLSHK